MLKWYSPETYDQRKSICRDKIVFILW